MTLIYDNILERQIATGGSLSKGSTIMELNDLKKNCCWEQFEEEKKENSMKPKIARRFLERNNWKLVIMRMGGHVSPCFRRMYHKAIATLRKEVA